MNLTTIFISKMESLPHTSDIKMIDIWLVLCQMVPFAEVVLLTAMEYHRRDEDMVVDLNVEFYEPGEKECQKCWVPQLKTIGDISTYHILWEMDNSLDLINSIR